MEVSKERTLLFVGASGGLGMSMIPILNAHYNLALHYHNSDKKLNEVIDALDDNADVKTYRADITEESGVEALIRNVESDFGAIDILVNAAGITASGVSWKMDLKEWQKTMDINTTGPFLTIKHTLPGMRNRNFGRIINISSVVGQNGVVGTSAYAASKSALTGMVIPISKEVANKNITVNNIALGYFNAGMINEIPEDIQDEIRNSIPKKSFGEPSELAECILYLSSEKTSYLTGQTINLNGGLHA